MEDSPDSRNQKHASLIRPGEFVGWWGDTYVQVLRVRKEAQSIYLTIRNPLTGLPLESEYEPEDLVIVRSGAE